MTRIIAISILSFWIAQFSLQAFFAVSGRESVLLPAGEGPLAALAIATAATMLAALFASAAANVASSRYGGSAESSVRLAYTAALVWAIALSVTHTVSAGQERLLADLPLLGALAVSWLAVRSDLGADRRAVARAASGTRAVASAMAGSVAHQTMLHKISGRSMPWRGRS